MFYRWVKWLLLAAALVSVVCGLALAGGWLGLNRTGFVLQLGLFTTGLFVFYQTRREKIRQGWLVLPVMAIHIMALPLALFMTFAIQNEQWAQNYWFGVNMAMLVGLGMAWLLLLISFPLPALVRTLLVLISAGYLLLLCLHMAGSFSNGKVIFFSGILVFTGTILLVFLGIRKPVSPAEEPPAAE